MNASLSRIIVEPHRVNGDTLEVAARFESPGAPPQRLWWRLPASWSNAVTPWADPFAIAFLFPMMQAGGEALIEGRVSPSLLASLESYMTVSARWEPNLYKPLIIRAADEIEAPPPATPGDTIMPFSCGVDSSFTALRHHRQLLSRRNHRVAGAVVLNGFDIWLDQHNAPAMYAGVLLRSRTMLGSLNIPCIPMSNNFHELPTTWAHSFGTQLVSGLRLLARRFDAALIPNSEPYSEPLTAWGSTPLTDPFLSSRHFPVIDDGGEASRIDKIELIATWPEALQHLRVCYENQGSDANCCRCEKCIRSVLSFRIAGLPPAHFRARRHQPSDPPRPTHPPDQLRPLARSRPRRRRRGLDRESWVRAMRSAERLCRRRWFLNSIRRPFIPFRDSIRKIFRGSPQLRRQRAQAVSASAASPAQEASNLS